VSRRFFYAAAVLPLLVTLAVLGAPRVGSGRASAGRGSRVSNCPTSFAPLIRNGFPEPRLLFSQGGALNVTLRETPGHMRLNRQRVDTMEFNGGLPGPTLVACPGDRLTVRLVNDLSQPTNLHVHGLHVSPRGDGDNVFIAINPHQSHTYGYRIPRDQSAGAFWYHPHDHMLVDHQLVAGLAGAIVVRGGLDDALGRVPQALIVVQGGKPGTQGLPPGQGCHTPGFGLPQPPGCPPSGPGPQLIPSSSLQGIGPYLVNGVINPTIKIHPGEIQRWRIFNATADSFLYLSLGGQPFYVLAHDGETLRHMQKATVLMIGPGSRREVLVRGAAPGRYSLTRLPFQQCSRSCADPIANDPPDGRPTPKGTLLTVLSTGSRAHERMPTPNLGGNGLPDLRKLHVDVRRSVLFGRMPSQTGPPAFPLNSMLFDPHRVDVTMQLNSVEQWTLLNSCTPTSAEWHSFHIHQNPFQVISINGVPVPYVDYEDTVSLPPCSTVVIRMRPIDFTGKFVFHCHLVFHEDQGMMGVVQVVGHLSQAQRRADTVYVGGMISISSSAYGSGQSPPTPTIPAALAVLCRPLVALSPLTPVTVPRRTTTLT
jgi:FtsP/CotA-like multicopper oxidase with cupredoxin domain